MNESESKNEKPKEERRFDPELLKKGLRCELDQYDMLKRCSDNKNISGWNQWRKKHRDEEILLEGVDFTRWYLKGAYLEGAKLQNAILWEAKLQGANLRETCLQKAKLMRAHLEGVEFGRANLQKADFSRAIVDGGTLIWDVKVDPKTKFEGVVLDAARIYPEDRI